jgi:putative transposase
LDAGPAVWGWTEDQRWTLARVTVLVGRLFHLSYTPRGISYLLHRMGWSPQVPQCRAAERDEETIATWVKDTWPLAEQRRGTRPCFIRIFGACGVSMIVKSRGLR